MIPIKIKTSEIQIGDTVGRVSETTYDEPFSTCIVNQIKDGLVHLFRPYGTTVDFSYTGGVIPFIGIEQYQVEVDSDILWTLFRRQELR